MGSSLRAQWLFDLTPKNESSFHVRLTDIPLYTFGLTTRASDVAFAQATGISPATYDITVVSPHTLLNVRRGVVISAPTTSVNMGTLLDGNANDDRIINIADFGILSVSYGKQSGQTGFDVRADFDRNNKINIADFGLLSINYAKTAPVTVP